MRTNYKRITRILSDLGADVAKSRVTVSKLDPSMTDGYSWKHLNAIRQAIAKAEGNES